MGPVQRTLDENNLKLEISFNIRILDDQIHELNEFFIVRLSSIDTDVILSPQETRVRITDNDGICIQFVFIHLLLY